MEIKSIDKKDIVSWSRPKRIKEQWLNAVIDEPIFDNKNIQFIMRCNYDKLDYLVVSQRELSLEEIEKIDLNQYIFEGLSKFSRGLKIEKEGVANA